MGTTFTPLLKLMEKSSRPNLSPGLFTLSPKNFFEFGGSDPLTPTNALESLRKDIPVADARPALVHPLKLITHGIPRVKPPFCGQDPAQSADNL